MNERGYTVLEALVAFAILGVVLVSLFSAGGTALDGVGRGARVRDMALLAQSKLAELAAYRRPLAPIASGAFADAGAIWTIVTRDIPGPSAPFLRLQDVELTVTATNSQDQLVIATRHVGVVRP